MSEEDKSATEIHRVKMYSPKIQRLNIHHLILNFSVNSVVSK